MQSNSTSGNLTEGAKRRQGGEVGYGGAKGAKRRQGGAKRRQGGAKGAKPIDPANIRQLAFATEADEQKFIASGAIVQGKLPAGVGEHARAEFDNYQWPLNKLGDNETMLTKAGWALENQHLTYKWMVLMPLVMASLNLDIAALALAAFGLNGGYACWVSDRWKNQSVGPGHKEEESAIVRANCYKPNSLHVDCRELQINSSSEYQLACLANVGPGARHMVVTDLQGLVGQLKSAQRAFASRPCDETRCELEAEQVRHDRILQLLHFVQSSSKGFDSKFSDDEKRLMESVLRAVRIEAGEFLLFPQFLPHTLTESTTSTVEQDALTIYLGLKLSESLQVVEKARKQSVDVYHQGRSFVYMRNMGKNALQNAAINARHKKRVLDWVWNKYANTSKYNQSLATGGSGGAGGFCAASSPMPTMQQFVADVLTARTSPDAYPETQACWHLGTDEEVRALVYSEDELFAAMPIFRF